MPIAKITGQGLAAIACSVGLLWGCVVLNRVQSARALEERVRLMQEVRQHRAVPVLDRSPFTPSRTRITAG